MVQDFKPKDKSRGKAANRRRQPPGGGGMGPVSAGEVILTGAFRRRWLPTWPTLLVGGLLAWVAMGVAIKSLGFWNGAITALDIQGNRYLSREEIMAAARFPGIRLKDIDPYQAAARIAALPRVLQADVRRQFPGRIRIVVTEREPVAWVGLERRRLAQVDGAGVVLAVISADKAPQVSLPMVRLGDPKAQVGERLDTPAWRRASAALQALEGLDLPRGNGVALVTIDPFSTVLRLGANTPWLLLPPKAERQALRVYLLLGLKAQGLLAGYKTLDLRVATQQESPRAFLIP